MIWLRLLLCLVVLDGTLGNLEEPDAIWSTLVTPKITGAQRVSPDGLGYPEIMNLTVGEFTLHLKLNKELISPSFKRKHYENDKEIIEENHANCFYQGTVQGYPKWRVSVSTCHGLIGQFGDAAYLIKPLDKSNYAIEAPHYLYIMAEDDSDTASECGSIHHNPVRRNILSENERNELKNRVKRENTLMLELAVVVDKAEYNLQGGDLEVMTNRLFNVINFMDDVYRTYLNMRIVLVYMDIWTESNQMTVSKTPETLLSDFRIYAAYNIPVSWDSAQFVTGKDLNGGRIGLAYIGYICSLTGVGINQDAHSDYSKLAATMTHELGHNLGMYHDDDSTVPCNCPDTLNLGKCIMLSSIGYPVAVDFTDCSQTDFWNRYPDNLYGPPCLDNWPHTFVMPPVCGNGLLEDGEACDCGTIEECTNPCCDPTTCTPSSGNICASGPCCNLASCDYSERGTVCRGPVDDCDIAEYCTGTSAECSSTDYQHSFGFPCTSTDGEQSTCGSGGTCLQSLKQQCAFEYGGSSSAHEDCYSLNAQGVAYGHCGNDPVAAVYLPCAQEDIKCGLMFCTGYYNYVWHDGISPDITTYTKSVNGHQCLTISSSASQPLTTPGLIDDGTYCDTDKICIAQKCTPLSDVIAPCANGPNGLLCSGKGYCSQFGTCACEYDASGDACQYDFFTGDIDECLYNLDNCQSGCINTIGSFTCTCNTGYVLASNEWECEDLNECDAGVHNCHHGCVNNEGSYTCTCNTGYSLDSDGWSCSDVNECQSGNGGCSQTCTNTAGSFSCGCNTGYILGGNGMSCNDVDECSVSTHNCQHGCVNNVGSYSCTCNAGYVLDGDGVSCNDVNECQTNNGGCSQTCSNIIGSFLCGCNTGYTLDSDGLSCNDVNECSVGTHNCQHGCVNNVGSYSCTCNAGYVLDGDGMSCNDVNECQTNNGGCSQTCTNTDGTFSCGCNTGYILGGNGMSCNDVDECSVGTHNCQHGCVNNVGSYSCTCNAGYVLDGDGVSCNDVNECQTNNGGCSQTCSNNIGSFSCGCNTGYSLDGDGRSCLDVNECQTNNGGCSQTCSNIIGSFLCGCNTGYTLDSDGLSCNDVNECSGGTHNCQYGCVNNVGSYSCTCNAGYVLDGDGMSCNDVNECQTNNGGCSQTCTNTDGTFSCGCNTGYILGGNGMSCNDVDECSVGTHNCQHGCVNNVGSYSCTCNAGYVLDGDGVSCNDVNECQTNNGGCSQTCSNIIGSFLCGCNTGYTLDSDGLSCNDVNECSVGTHNCQHGCVNNVDSYSCTCNVGYILDGDGMSCNDVNECQTNNGGCSQTCSNNIGSFSCGCNTGYTLDGDGRSCLDVNECQTNNGGCSQTCSNIIGSFLCGCNTGYTLDSDGLSCNDVNECSVGTHNCQHGCVNNVGSYSCTCNVGYVLDGDGVSCNDVNECQTNNGGCSQTCSNNIGSFSCGCNTGYTLDGDGRSCLDVNECQTNNGGCSQTCSNIIGSFLCGCNTGYTLDSDGISCNDIDECTAGTNNCQHSCVNTAGSFTCTCNTGYNLDNNGWSCSDINECSSNNGGCSQTCANTLGSFSCGCYDGYSLNNNNGISCIDVNECALGTDNCEYSCVNTVGSYTCTCNTGYALNNDGWTCSDMNECSSNNGGCSHTCTNTIGSFSCGCNGGYLLNSNGILCNDVNECAEGLGDCQHNCVNTLGTFTCTCNEGFTLTGNGKNCTDVDRCANGNGGCSQLCFNTVDSFYCDCNPGYALSNDDSTCTDVNECQTNNGGCSQTCSNNIGSFSCGCNTGLTLSNDTTSCNDVDECSNNNGGCIHLCNNTAGSFFCECHLGYVIGSDTFSCEDVDECAIDNGGCDHTCTNMDGSYECNCRRRYTLTADGHTCNATIANDGSGGQQKVPAIAGGVGGGLIVIVAIGGGVVALAVFIMSKKNHKKKTEITPMNSVRVTDSSSRTSRVIQVHSNLDDSDMQPIIAVDHGEEAEQVPPGQLDADKDSIQSHTSITSQTAALLPPEDEAAPTACSSTISFHSVGSALLVEPVVLTDQAFVQGRSGTAQSVHPSDIQIDAFLSSTSKASDRFNQEMSQSKHKLSTHSSVSMHSAQEVMIQQSPKECPDDTQQQPDTSTMHIITQQVEGAPLPPLSTGNSLELPAPQQHQARPRRPSNIPIPMIQVKPTGDKHSPTQSVRHKPISGAQHDYTNPGSQTQNTKSTASTNEVTESPLPITRQRRPSKVPVPTSAMRHSRVAKSDTAGPSISSISPKTPPATSPSGSPRLIFSTEATSKPGSPRLAEVMGTFAQSVSSKSYAAVKSGAAYYEGFRSHLQAKQELKNLSRATDHDATITGKNFTPIHASNAEQPLKEDGPKASLLSQHGGRTLSVNEAHGAKPSTPVKVSPRETSPSRRASLAKPVSIRNSATTMSSRLPGTELTLNREDKSEASTAHSSTSSAGGEKPVQSRSAFYEGVKCQLNSRHAMVNEAHGAKPSTPVKVSPRETSPTRRASSAKPVSVRNPATTMSSRLPATELTLNREDKSEASTAHSSTSSAGGKKSVQSGSAFYEGVKCQLNSRHAMVNEGNGAKPSTPAKVSPRETNPSRRASSAKQVSVRNPATTMSSRLPATELTLNREDKSEASTAHSSTSSAGGKKPVQSGSAFYEGVKCQLNSRRAMVNEAHGAKPSTPAKVSPRETNPSRRTSPVKQVSVRNPATTVSSHLPITELTIKEDKSEAHPSTLSSSAGGGKPVQSGSAFYEGVKSRINSRRAQAALKITTPDRVHKPDTSQVQVEKAEQKSVQTTQTLSPQQGASVSTTQTHGPNVVAQYKLPKIIVPVTARESTTQSTTNKPKSISVRRSPGANPQTGTDLAPLSKLVSTRQKSLPAGQEPRSISVRRSPRANPHTETNLAPTPTQQASTRPKSSAKSSALKQTTSKRPGSST